MSSLVSRILLAVLIIPSAALLELIASVFLERAHFYGPRATFWCSGLGAVYTAVYWLLLWRREVVWSAMRVRETWWSAALAVFAGAAMAAAVRSKPFGGDELASFIGVHLAVILWLIATVCIWRETSRERTARLSGSDAASLVCPACGYSLRGLHEARCPECGAHYTLDELYALQRNRAPAEIERGD